MADPPEASAEETERTVAWSRSGPAGLPESLPTGQVLAGRFRIVRFLGQGGMGDVYEAEDQELKERVALKTVRPEIARLPGALDRFTREIQLARKVTHPNVCRIFDVSHHGEVTFLTMELLQGETLECRLRQAGAFSEGEALPLVRQVAEGLAAAHRLGIVHRDFKPANVMLVPEPDGGVRAVVTDFGLARGAEAAGDGLTLQGDVLGTPAYMAPEQVTAEEITPATDVYAFGVVLYEMSTGVQPFVGETALSTAVKRLREDPLAPRLRAPSLDPAWEAAILRCLAREPRDRFARIQDAAGALVREPVVDQPTVVLARQRPKPRWLPWAAVPLVLLAVAGGAWLWNRSDREDAVVYALEPELVASARGEPGASPSNPEAREAYFNGLDALQKFDASLAKEYLTEAVQAEPAFPLAHSALAAAWHRLGDQGKAAEEAKAARDLARNLPEEQRQLVEARFWEIQPRWDQAIQSYRKLFQRSPNLEYGLGLARAQTGAGLAVGALETVQALRRLPPPASQDPRIDLAEAEASQVIGDLGRQEKAASAALVRGEAMRADLLVARALFLQGSALAEDPEKARETLEKAKTAYAGAGDLRGAADALKAIGDTYYTFQGDCEQAQSRYEEAHKTYESIKDKRGVASTLLALANCTAEVDLAQGEEMFRGALRLYRANADREGEAQVLGNLGLARQRQGDLAGAVRNAQESLAIYEKLGNQRGIAGQLRILANTSLDQLKLAEAEADFEKALALSKAIGDEGAVIEILLGRGTARAYQGDLDAAAEDYQGALDRSRRQKDDGRKAEAQQALALVRLEKGMLSQAEDLARGALEWYQRQKDLIGQAEAEALLARVFLAQGDVSRARGFIDQADQHLAGSQEPGASIPVALAAAQVLVAEKKIPEARRRLETALQEAREARFAALEREVRLALEGLDQAAKRLS